jgi:hypothetical protein
MARYWNAPVVASSSSTILVAFLTISTRPGVTSPITLAASAGPGKGADLGGLEGADRVCQTLAQAAGAGSKTWRAYLSTQAVGGAQAVNARDRIGNGPWKNAKGVVVATNLDNLHSASANINKQTGQWGHSYNKDMDLGRVPMDMSKPPAVIETYKRRKRDRLVKLFKAARYREPELLADEVFLLFEGARISIQCGGKGPASRVVGMLRSLLAARARRSRG